MPTASARRRVAGARLAQQCCGQLQSLGSQLTASGGDTGTTVPVPRVAEVPLDPVQVGVYVGCHRGLVRLSELMGALLVPARLPP